MAVAVIPYDGKDPLFQPFLRFYACPCRNAWRSIDQPVSTLLEILHVVTMIVVRDRRVIAVSTLLEILLNTRVCVQS